MSEKAILRETGRLDTKINALNDEFKKIVARRKFRIVEIEIEDKLRKNEAEFWRFSIFLDNTRICKETHSNRRIVRENDVFDHRRDLLTFGGEKIRITVTDWCNDKERLLFERVIRVEDIDFKTMEYVDEFKVDRPNSGARTVGEIETPMVGKIPVKIQLGNPDDAVKGTFRLRVKFEMCD